LKGKSISLRAFSEKERAKWGGNGDGVGGIRDFVQKAKKNQVDLSILSIEKKRKM
jgi:hypothetical protein